MMFHKPNHASGVAVYVQLMEQVRHAVEVGALRPGDRLPPIRKVAEELVVNPNTVARVYRELEHEGVIELRQGAGAFVVERVEPSEREALLRKGATVARGAAARMAALGLAEEEMRRLFEAEMRRLHEEAGDEEDAARTGARRK